MNLFMKGWVDGIIHVITRVLHFKIYKQYLTKTSKTYSNLQCKILFLCKFYVKIKNKIKNNPYIYHE